MMERYRRANEALHPTQKAVEGAVSAAGTPGRARRPGRKGRRALIPAALAAVVAVVLLITGIPGLTGGPVAGTAYAIAQPDYPELPKCPVEPLNGDDAAWEQFSEDYDTYWAAWRDFRNTAPGLDDQPGLRDALELFTARSTALTLTGGTSQSYSPISLWFALAMLAETTGGESRQEILSVLGAESLEQLRSWADTLWHDLYTDDGTASLLLGSSIWLNQSADFRREVLELLAQSYYAGSYQVPMGTADADEALSQWVSQQTKGLIGGDGPVLETTPDTMMVLASTLYYKAGWRSEFQPENTRADTFTTAGGERLTADFMHRTADGSFIRREGYQAAALSTTLGEMVFVLPDEGVHPSDLLTDEAFLSSLDFDGQDARFGEIQWSVPKFDSASTLDLIPTLEALGMTAVLDPEQADFSPLSDLEMWLEQAKQIARVRIDETGVEAAAVTLMAGDGSAPLEDMELCIMDLDRPFLFLIRSDSGVVLFAGMIERV